VSPVLVTGASRGIGHAAAASLVSQGVAIVGVYHRAPGGLSTLPAPLVTAVQADLTTDVGRAAVVQACAGLSLGGVVHAAGVAARAPLEQDSSGLGDPLRVQLAVDLEAPLLLTRALLGAGVMASGCSMVFVSSNLARHGLPGKVAYSAAKAGIEGAVRGLAAELGPRGIRVNAVAPGLIRTDMTAGRSDDELAAYAAEVPLRRVGTPQDVAHAICYLVGPQAGFVSGQVLDVDGGWGL
jgi:NAD(P)-dependent dehydrogenase (short-subunit alcohol dehydrogenase family)